MSFSRVGLWALSLFFSILVNDYVEVVVVVLVSKQIFHLRG